MKNIHINKTQREGGEGSQSNLILLNLIQFEIVRFSLNPEIFIFV